MTRARLCTLLLALGAWAAVSAGTAAAAAMPMAFDAAWQQLQVHSDRLASARAATDVKAQQRRGIEGLGGPSVSLSGVAAGYHAALSIDLEAINGRLAQLGQQLPIPLENLPIPLPVPQLPPSYTYARQGTLATASVSAVMPVYLGGAADAARGLVSAEEAEAGADARRTAHELSTLLAQRYFGALLAQQAARFRDVALADIAAHDAGAEKMLATGVISRLERLQARAAYEEARRQALKARSDAELATQALSRLLLAEGAVEPTTPLFILTQPLPPLADFVGQALQGHPGLDKVAAKQAQAERLHEASRALRRPQVFVFGQRDFRRPENSNWVAGVGARWTLYDALDRDALDASAAARVTQAERSGAQARSDIALLVERHWRAAEHARVQVLSMQASLDLAHELIRVRTASLREGTGTTLERMDADLNLAKVGTERAQAAHDYVMALAQLLEACGRPEQLLLYIARADLTLP